MKTPLEASKFLSFKVRSQMMNNKTVCSHTDRVFHVSRLSELLIIMKIIFGYNNIFQEKERNNQTQVRPLSFSFSHAHTHDSTSCFCVAQCGGNYGRTPQAMVSASHFHHRHTLKIYSRECIQTRLASK